MSYYHIKFKNGSERFMTCNEGFDVGNEIIKWNDPELVIDNVEECNQHKKEDFEDISTQDTEQEWRAKLAAKRPIKIDVKAQYLQIEQEKARKQAMKDQAMKDRGAKHG